jgi:hypothetical protein
LYSSKYKSLFFITGALLSGVNATIFWFSLMWFVAGSGLMQMWIGAHLVTLGIGFALSLGISVLQAEHIPEVIYRSCQLGSKAVLLIPASTAFRAISDSLLPSENFSIGGRQFDSVEVFTLATALAMLLFVLFTLFSWLAEKRMESG